MSDKPAVSLYKGNPILCLNPEARFPFQFGVAKACLILDNLQAIRDFVDANPPKEKADRPQKYSGGDEKEKFTPMEFPTGEES